MAEKFNHCYLVFSRPWIKGEFLYCRVYFLLKLLVFFRRKRLRHFSLPQKMWSLFRITVKEGDHMLTIALERHPVDNGRHFGPKVWSMIFFSNKPFLSAFFNVVSLANKFFLPCHLNFESEYLHYLFKWRGFILIAWNENSLRTDKFTPNSSLIFFQVRTKN